jgi:lipoate-protein ligase A
MKYLDLTFIDPAHNLACDEALADLCETNLDGEILRIWEPANYFAVVGYSNKIALEVDVDACRAREIPILRRFSGGGAVLQGPGCLNYTLVIKNEQVGYFADVAKTYRRVLEPHRRIFQALTSAVVQIEGICDLTIAGRKISGNAQHRKRFYSVFHGTFLLDFDFSLVENCLRMPSRQPDYRESRAHRSFLRNLSIDPQRVRKALKKEWRADEEAIDIPYEPIDDLVRRRYSRDDWNFKF